MIKTIGSIMIITSCSMLGINMSGELRRRSRAIRQQITALQLLRTEILYKNTPLEEILIQMEHHIGPETARFYQKTFEMAAHGMAFSAAACKHYDLLRQEGLLPEDIEAIRSACQVLGRYDSMTQSEGLLQAVQLLEENQKTLKTDLLSKGRICRAAGMTAGIVLVLMVL